MLKNIWSTLQTQIQSEKLVLSLLSCQVHSFLCTHAWCVIRKIRKYTCKCVRCFWASPRCCPWCWIHGYHSWLSKMTTETRNDLSLFNIFSCPLVTPEDQVMRTWGSGFSRITGVQYTKLVSSCTFSLCRLHFVFLLFHLFLSMKKMIKT